nr:reverse transcriptase domain-containing protein [Tanacetum cinerariifolium]
MSTRSSTRNIFPPPENPKLTIQRRTRVDPSLLNNFEEINMAANGNGDDGPPAGGGDLPVPDLQIIEELCQPILNGRGGPIATIAIQATDFRLKNDMIQQVQNSCQFHGLPGDDANKHLDKKIHVTQSINVNGVSDDTLRLYLFPHSLTHHATAWFDHLPRNSITKFEQMAKMFLEKYFPPSMVTKLRNQITKFHQRPDESLFEAWERYKLSIDRCPNHNMLPVTQLDTFYNGLTLRHRDTINATAGGTFMKRRPKECYDLIENIIAHHNDWDTFAQRRTLPSNTITNPKEDLKGIPTRSGITYKGPTIPTTTSPPKVVECETKMIKDMVPPTNNRIEAPVSAPKPNPKPSIPYPYRLNDQKLREKANNQMEKFFQIFQDLNFNISFMDALILMPKFALTIKSLLTNKERLSESTRTPLNEHCLAVLLKKLPKKLRDPGKFIILCDFSGIDECLALADLGASINLMPLSVWKNLSLPKLSPTFITLELANRSISHPVDVKFNLDQTSRYSSNYDAESINQTDVIDVACEEYSQEVLRFSVSGNPTPFMEPIFSTSSPTLTPFGDSNFLLEETNAFQAIEDEPISPKINDSYYDSKRDILLFYVFLNDDPSSPLLPPQELKVAEPKNEKYSIDEPPVVELKDLPPHLEYAFFRGVNPKFHEVIKKDVLKLLDAGLIYPISNSPWLSPVHCVPKKGGITIVENDEEKLIPTRLVTGWRTPKIKKRPHSLVLMERLPTVVCLSAYVMHQSSGGGFTARKPLIFLRLATINPSKDIMARTTPLKRCLTLVSIGPQFIVMPMTWSNLTTLVIVTGKSRKKMKCPKMPSKFARSLTYGASISCGRSHLHEGTSTYSWRSTTCLNGLKRKRSPPMTLELLLKF